jgi:hypothetical protein
MASPYFNIRMYIYFKYTNVKDMTFFIIQCQWSQAQNVLVIIRGNTQTSFASSRLAVVILCRIGSWFSKLEPTPETALNGHFEAFCKS